MRKKSFATLAFVVAVLGGNPCLAQLNFPYPKEPGAVVSSFLEARMKFQIYPENREMHDRMCRKVLQHVKEETRYTEICGGGVDILARYKILRTEVRGNRATVWVHHKFCGGCANDWSCGIEKNSVVEPYTLRRQKGRWLIHHWQTTGCPNPCGDLISPEEVLRRSAEIKSEPDKWEPSLVKQQDEVVHELKKCMRGE